MADLARLARTPRPVVDRRRHHRLGAYGFVACLQPSPDFGRILAAYGGIFVAGSLAWGTVVDKYRPDWWDLVGAGICLIGVAVIMYVPRGAHGS